METIEVPDILIAKGGQLHSMRDQKVWKNSTGHTFGVGSGVVKNGILYTLRVPTLLTMQTFVPNPADPIGTVVNLTDERDGIVYRCIKMADGRWWMGENLRYDIEGSTYYNNDVANLATYGRLYNWQKAQDTAPDNWSVPNDNEWKVLEMALGMTQADADTSGTWRESGGVGMKLKEGGSSGLNLLLGGYELNGSYDGLSSYGYYWTSMESHSLSAWHRTLYSDNTGVYRAWSDKASRFSIRLILNQ